MRFNCFKFVKKKESATRAEEKLLVKCLDRKTKKTPSLFKNLAVGFFLSHWWFFFPLKANQASVDEADY